MLAIDRLISRIIEKRNPTAVGLDTRIEYVPDFICEKFMINGKMDLEGAASAIFEFNKRIIDAVHDLVPAVKVQVAYYEMYGPEGLKAFKDTIEYARSKDLVIIGDIKRNDIDSTAAAYSAAHIGMTNLLGSKAKAFDMDFATVNPYLGSDGINPFIEDCKEYKNGLFVLVKTSNKSSGEFQDLEIGDNKLYELVGDMVSKWGSSLTGEYGYSSVGAVVGATYPSQGEELRKRMPYTFFLVPGYGAQGAGAKDIMGCFDSKGLGAVINASRSIICAYKREPWKDIYSAEDFDKAAREEVLAMKKNILEAMADRGMS